MTDDDELAARHFACEAVKQLTIHAVPSVSPGYADTVRVVIEELALKVMRYARETE